MYFSFLVLKKIENNETKNKEIKCIVHFPFVKKTIAIANYLLH